VSSKIKNNRLINNIMLTFVAIISYLPGDKKISHNHLAAGSDLTSHEKQSRENVWCTKYGYFSGAPSVRSHRLPTITRPPAGLIWMPVVPALCNKRIATVVSLP
jgi:hypothetical protein